MTLLCLYTLRMVFYVCLTDLLLWYHCAVVVSWVMSIMQFIFKVRFCLYHISVLIMSDNFLSVFHSVSCGVPQGSIQGPCFYALTLIYLQKTWHVFVFFKCFVRREIISTHLFILKYKHNVFWGENFDANGISFLPKGKSRMIKRDLQQNIIRKVSWFFFGP